ncbi:MAG: 50S ribosomal protein L24 [Candidatus Aramenus sulfurataquae]|jgi:large subunit ribosomal protein L24e|uniref:Large ribosomal subunit protein eL24 n=2 Tax=Candidatus Aramenus sulfurataquae TaxID=1326980 RepID=W7KX08_9CREN|nr:MAG: 50S ribosomal protein L24 [Candidatus Aramenus sulfurataquae]MCL7343413.1 50S ribosomal protein L24e [Candidatus Aramenus sulfurataquae]
MPSSHTCSFCGATIVPGTGIMYVKNDGAILWFCSSKCRKYMLKYHKDAKRLKWTTSYSRVR